MSNKNMQNVNVQDVKGAQVEQTTQTTQNTQTTQAAQATQVETATPVYTAEQVRTMNTARRKAAIAARVEECKNIPELLSRRVVDYVRIDEFGAETPATALAQSVDMMTEETRKAYMAMCRNISALALAARVENEQHTGKRQETAPAVVALRKAIKAAWGSWGVKNDVSAIAMLAFATRATMGKAGIDLKTSAKMVVDAIDGAFVASIIKKGKVCVLSGKTVVDFRAVSENAAAAETEMFGLSAEKAKKTVIEQA